MSRFVVDHTIRAPIDLVFHTVADIREYRKAQPQIVNVDILTPQQVGVGTRFRETRLLGKREATAEFEVTEFVENSRVRIVTEAGGTVWDTTFTVSAEPSGRETRLKMSMDALPRNIFARLMNAMIGGVIRKGIAADMDRLKDYCESVVR